MAYPLALSGDGRDMHPSPEAKTLERIRTHERERRAAKAILAEILALGLTPELLERGRLFLESSLDDELRSSS